MQQIEEIRPSAMIEPDGISLKTELTEPTSIAQPLLIIEPNGTAPLAPNSAQIITLPIATSQPSVTRPKPLKRKLRIPFSTRKPSRFTTPKPSAIVARPTIRPAPTTPSIIPKNSPQVSTTYLVFDGNQTRVVQVPNNNQQPVTFRNESGQILQATPVNVLSAPNATNPSSVIPSFTINGDCSLLSNSSQTVTTVRTSSSIDLQQQTLVTSDTTTLTGILHPPTPIVSATILNSTDNVRTVDPTLSLSLNQLAEKVHQRHRRSSSSSYSRKKRGRPRLYERDPFPPKPLRTNGLVETTDVTVPTVLLPTTTPQAYNPILFPTPSPTVPLAAPSLIQQHPYSYPSLLCTPPAPTLINLFPSKTESQLVSPTNHSPKKTSTNDKIVHYIGGYYIRESRQGFSPKEKEKEKENSSVLFQCQICQAMDIQSRFFDCERRVCSKECLNLLNERTTSKPIETNISPVQNDETTHLPPDHGLPVDPTKWTVAQVGDFIGRLTNLTIRDAFFESEMDGQALLLITPEHLRETMKIKLGPSLIISSEIAKLRERAAKSNVSTN